MNTEKKGQQTHNKSIQQFQKTRSSRSTLLPELKTRSQSILTKSRLEIFPTINGISKNIKQVDSYYENLTSKAIGNKLSKKEIIKDKQMNQIKKAIQNKIDEKRKIAINLQIEQSKIRWALEREAKQKLQNEQKQKLKHQLNFTEQQRKKLQEIKNKQRKEQVQFLKHDTIKKNSIQKNVKSQSKNKKLSKIQMERNQLRINELLRLKGMLRDECEHLIKQQDAFNSVLVKLKK